MKRIDLNTGLAILFFLAGAYLMGPPVSAQIVRSGGGGGASLSADNSWTGEQTFQDNKFLVVDDGDTTKKVALQVSGVTTATTRTLTVPNVNSTLCVAGANCTWTTSQTLASDVDLGIGTGFLSGFTFSTTDTPDSLEMGTGAASNAVIFTTRANLRNGDYAVAQQANPTFVVTDGTVSAEDRFGLSHNGTQGRLTDLANTAANQRPIGLHGGAAVASAATITPTGNVFHVTGTTTITSVTAMASGTVITIIFDGILTFTDGSNLKLVGDVTTAANTQITLACDGTNWFEVARAAPG